jgi:hypothetical protein
MATQNARHSRLELFDVAKKEKVAEAALAEVKFIPRTGERVFIPAAGPGHWDSYTVVAVEYFLGETSTGEPSVAFGKITLYVEESK